MARFDPLLGRLVLKPEQITKVEQHIAGGGGTNNHSDLINLSHNDHPQYLLASNNLSDIINADTALVNLGLTATATELNYTDGVTSAIQTQLNAKLDDSQATAFGLSLLDDPNAAAGRTTLELVAGGAGDIWVEKAGDTSTGPQLITGSTNAVQFKITGNATQTANLAEIRDSSNELQFYVMPDGQMGTGGLITTDDNINLKVGIISTEIETATTGTYDVISAIPFLNPSGATNATYRGARFLMSSLSSNAQDFSGTLQGGDFTAQHAGSGASSGTGLAGGRFLAVKSGTGQVGTAVAGRFFVQNTNATAAIVNGYALRATAPTATGAITTQHGLEINNQGSANITTSYALRIDAQSGSSSANWAIRVDGGAVVFNESGTDSDFRIESDTDANAFFVDASANTVQVGAATASDSAKFYVSGKISTSGELEVNGDLNHDGTNVGFYGVATVTQPTAYTQTYATADKTHAAFTSADIGAFTGGSVGFLDAAERDNIRTQYNALRADLADAKQVINSLIDDLQSLGLVG